MNNQDRTMLSVRGLFIEKKGFLRMAFIQGMITPSWYVTANFILNRN